MYISPMLLGRVEVPFDDTNYITELKLDGIRLTLSKWDNQVKLYSRHRNEVTNKFKELLDIDIPNGTVIDGEIVVADTDGKPDFEAMMERFQSSKSNHRIQYLVFDVVYWEGKKVTQLPLLKRKELLHTHLPEHPYVYETQWIEGNATAYFNLVKEQGLEGIVQKKRDSKYAIDKRSNDWLKVINYSYQNVVVTGYRKSKFGLLLGIKEEGKKIKNVGLLEFMPVNERREFYNQAKIIKTNETKDFVFIEPTIEYEVKFRNWTKAGKLRIPSYSKKIG